MAQSERLRVACSHVTHGPSRVFSHLPCSTLCSFIFYSPCHPRLSSVPKISHYNIGQFSTFDFRASVECAILCPWVLLAASWYCQPILSGPKQPNFCQGVIIVKISSEVVKFGAHNTLVTICMGKWSCLWPINCCSELPLSCSNKDQNP